MSTNNESKAPVAVLLLPELNKPLLIDQLDSSPALLKTFVVQSDSSPLLS